MVSCCGSLCFEVSLNPGGDRVRGNTVVFAQSHLGVSNWRSPLIWMIERLLIFRTQGRAYLPNSKPGMLLLDLGHASAGARDKVSDLLNFVNHFATELASIYWL